MSNSPIARSCSTCCRLSGAGGSPDRFVRARQRIEKRVPVAIVGGSECQEVDPAEYIALRRKSVGFGYRRHDARRDRGYAEHRRRDVPVLSIRPGFAVRTIRSSLGIERTFDQIGRASVILLLTDARDSVDDIYAQYASLSFRAGQRIALILNKCDCLPDEELLAEKGTTLVENPHLVLPLSAKRQINLDERTDF